MNMGLILIGGELIPPPEGIDLTTTEGLRYALNLLEPRHFLFPFLAHALGTFAGALVASILAASHRLTLAFTIGFVFLAGGGYMAVLLSGPTWFIVADLLGAYLPMAWAGWKLSGWALR